MTEHSNRLLILFALPLTLTALTRPVSALEPSEYTAVYAVSRNGETVANISLDLSRSGDEWTYLGFTHDMQGLGKLLQVEGRQAAKGTWQDGQFRPRAYTFSFSLVAYRSRWQADFDWATGTVVTGKKSRKTSLPLDNGAVDPMSLMLNTGYMLSQGLSELEVDVVDEDEIEHHLYRAEPGVWLATKLGCIKTTQVERVRNNNKRESMAWYADDAAYIPVKLQHLKRGGSDLQMSILSLVIDGKETAFPDACPPDPAPATP